MLIPVVLMAIATTVSNAQDLFGCYPLAATPTIARTSASMDPFTCAQLCVGSYSLALISPNGQQFACGCANTVNRAPSRVPAQCNMSCPQDSSKPCGGYSNGVFYWSVYSNLKSATLPTTPPPAPPPPQPPSPPAPENIPEPEQPVPEAPPVEIPSEPIISNPPPAVIQNPPQHALAVAVDSIISSSSTSSSSLSSVIISAKPTQSPTRPAPISPSPLHQDAAEPSPNDSFLTHNIMYIAIGVGVGVVICIAILVVVACRRKQRKTKIYIVPDENDQNLFKMISIP
ncbi:hypothetical protein BDR26DRAFT_860058 [Obelidium mucronatum]|nr:hypothetical protein BDR26DRAFT_860058 [Obelidium mucronatum]